MLEIAWTRELQYIGSTSDDVDVRIANHEDSDPANLSTLWYMLFNHASDVSMAAYAGTEGGPIEPFCTQQSGIACPCAGTGSLNGCANSAHPSGAGLAGTGFASTTHDTLTLNWTDTPPTKSSLMFQSMTTNQNLLGEGIICLSPPVIRFPVRMTNASGAAGYGFSYGDLSVHVRGSVPTMGGVYYYQVWFRDPVAFCTAATTNLTSAVKVTWTP
jgi:hypothetical protein